METTTDTLNRPLKHDQLRAIVRSAISSGKFKSGEKLPSENEMVVLYGVSRPTVREALGALVQEGVLDRFQGKGTFVAQGNVETKDIAFVLCGRDYTDPLFSMTLKGAETRCRELGGRLMYTHYDNRGEMAPVERRMIDHHPVRGLVVTGILDLKWLMRLIELNENVVLVGDVLGRNCTPDVVTRIVSNNGAAAGEVMQYLLGLGHRRIAHITGDLNRVWFREPYEAYVLGLKDRGILPDESLVVECEDEGLDYGHYATQRLLRLPKRPTAIFASNDRFAWGAIRAICEAQLRVPEDISVIGMSDLPLGDRRDFLTTMTIPQEQMGAIAVDRIVADASGGSEQIVVPMTLTVRQSCAALAER